MKAGVVTALATIVFISLAGGIATLCAEDTSDKSRSASASAKRLPPFSVRSKEGGSGFDFLIAQSLVKAIEPAGLRCSGTRASSIKISSTAIEANALLSDGRCDLAAGYPLLKDALGKPGLETARLPNFAGARPADRRRRVTLGTLMATTPYHFAGLAVVLGAQCKR